MMTKETIAAKSGLSLLIETQVTGDVIQVSIETKKQPGCLLHWGLRRHSTGPWQKPPKGVWPVGTEAFDKKAVRTPFPNHGTPRIAISLKRSSGFSSIAFVLFFPEQGKWDNNHGNNYQIRLPKPETDYSQVLQRLDEHVGDHAIQYKHVHTLQNRYHLGVLVTKGRHGYHVIFVTDMTEPLLLHWGVANHPGQEWVLPSSLFRPEGTTISDEKAVQTPFQKHESVAEIQLAVGEKDAPLGIPFVLKTPDDDLWLNDRGSNFFVPLIVPLEYQTAITDPRLASLADQIISQEMGNHSWTLMHRFNLCYDLLDQVTPNPDGWALMFVWLRFSALRQLDWQRDYNTKPRELSHAQDRLTQKLSQVYASRPPGREFVRWMLTTMGRGGQGQRVRDEVLNIMHRHHIKEVAGHFMEEWHQKLHNNTTPDDVVICEAYLAFLKSNGDLDLFYRQLEAGGVPKKRLKAYERPIVSDPDFIPHLKDALIHDFEEFLRILKGVHGGADLETAMEGATHQLEPGLQALIQFIGTHRADTEMDVVAMAAKITQARQQVLDHMERRVGNLRDLLYLDLALEDFLRVLMESRFHKKLTDQDLVAMTELVLENLLLTTPHKETAYCLDHWKRLIPLPHFNKMWSLEAKAVLDRLTRILGQAIDQTYQRLQPKAELLGKAFQAEPWTISLFTEEVVRGGLAFLLSTMHRKIDPLLRKSAQLGNWQVVSPGKETGELIVASTLAAVQKKRYSHRTVVLTEKITGEEEIPPHVTAILTPDTTDIVSHVAIRARNGRVLLASCYDTEILQTLRGLKGRWLSVQTTADGDVVFAESSKEEESSVRHPSVSRTTVHRPDFTAYALADNAFHKAVVGGKSNNLHGLKGKLPPWIGLPRSVALPFGVFEKVAAQEENKAVFDQYQTLLGSLRESSDVVPSDILAGLKQAISQLKAPADLVDALQGTFTQAGLLWPEDWKSPWSCITRVWASKWNERAYLSRQTMGIAHEDLIMAVLIQEVIEADYSFVIHTTNPFSQDKDEIYAEVVCGLGETLVGNYPGKSLSFTWKKGGNKPTLASFPSKSIGLFGGGLIFRSDSNGEDLADYAGAGLYDSVMLQEPKSILLDYAKTPLVIDDHFREDLLVHIATLGAAVEAALRSPQDIEGAYSKGKYHVVQTRPQVGLGHAS
jgi:alpha-glucan,water dikinase